MDQYQNPHLEGDAFFWEGGADGVLLCHGFTATSAEVRPLARCLHEAGYTVGGPLLPGHGSNPQDANQRTWQEWVEAAEQARQLIQKHCNRVFLGGESMGALLALYLASEQPQAAGILLYAPAIKLRSPVIAVLNRLLLPFMSIVQKPKAPITPADALWQGYTVYPLRALRQLFQLQKIVKARLPLIRQPLLIVQGRKDPSVHPSVPELIRSNVSSPQVEIHWMEASGHCVILDCQREETNAITLDFLGRL